MPLASKKNMQQKKRLLGEDDETASRDHLSNDVSTKTATLSSQDDELKESICGRPRRQAPCVATSKIEKSVKVADDLQRKMRRPNADRSDANNNVSSFPNSSSVQDLSERSGKRMMGVLPEARVVLNRLTSQQLKGAASNAVETKRASLRPKEKEVKRRPFVLENSEKGNKSTRQSVAQILAPKTLNNAKRIVVAAHHKSLISARRIEMKNGSPDLSERKSKKKANKQTNFVKSKETSPRLSVNPASKSTAIPPPPEISETFVIPNEPAEQEILHKKKVGKARKPVEGSSASAVVASTAAAPSPNASGDHSGNDVPTKEELSNEDDELKESIRGRPRRQASCVAKLKIQQCVTMGYNLKRKLRRPTADQSDANSDMWSFQEPSSVQDLSKHSGKRMVGVLPEARVVLIRLTSQQLKEAGNKSTRQSVAQILARKSLDKAKNIIATRNKLLTSATDKEATESFNVQINPNTETLMRKFRFAAASGSSGSSSSSSNVSMTQGKPVANIVTGIGPFRGTKPVRMVPTKATEEDELKRKRGLRQNEIEIAKAAAVADVAVPGPSTFNTTFTLPSSVTSNYQISPVCVTKNGKLFNPDNYEIGDMHSDDSPDNWFSQKETIPTWAENSNLKVAVKQQADVNMDPDQIFPGDMFLKSPNLNDMFTIKRERFYKRTSSADWETSISNTL